MSISSAHSPRKKCVVLDTNIWVYDTRLLRSPMGASILYYITTDNMLIGLPEIISQEVEKHALKVAQEATAQIIENYKTIEMLLGERDNYHIPTKDEIIASVNKRLSSLDYLFIRVPFSFEHAKGALNRIIDETPPNGPKNQQFKDSCIWESILELSTDYTVHFITQDKAFFENRDPKQGWAKNLLEELKQNQTEAKIHPSIESFLQDVITDTSGINKEKLTQTLSRKLLTDFTSSEATIKSIKDSHISSFLTEEPNILSLTFQVDLNADLILEDNSDEISGYLRIEGECSYNINEDNINNLSFNEVTKFKYDGMRLDKTIYLRAAVNIGSGTKKYKLRSPL